MKRYNIREAVEKRRIVPFSAGPKVSSKELRTAKEDLQDAERNIQAAEEAIKLAENLLKNKR